MTLHIGTSSGVRQVTRVVVGTAGGAKDVLAAYVGTPGGNRLVYASSFEVEGEQLQNWTLTEFPAEGGPISAYMARASATPLGGVGPYSYGWYVESGHADELLPEGDGGSCLFVGWLGSIVSPTVVRCAVVDSLGATGISTPVTFT